MVRLGGERVEVVGRFMSANHPEYKSKCMDSGGENF